MRLAAGFPWAGVVMAAVVLAAGAPAKAAIAEIAPSSDNFIMEDILDASCAIGNLYVGDAFTTSSRRGLLKFDIASEIPAGSTVNSVQLQLFIVSSEPAAEPTDTYGIYPLLEDWGESTGPDASDCSFGKGADAKPGDPTWSHRIWQTTAWASPGGNFSATPAASILMPLVGPATFPTNPSMVSQVQNWLNTPATNFGWIVIGGEGTSHSQREISSREGLSPPTLLVDYTAPLPTTPPEVPDGRLGPPLRVKRLTPDGADLEISWDTTHCTVNPDHNLVYGTRSTFPLVPTDAYGLQGTVCAPGGSSPFTWFGSPNAATLDPASKLIWMLIVANDGAGVEGSWGRRSNFSERNGPGSNGSSGGCGIANKSVANQCGQNTLRVRTLLDAREASSGFFDLEAP